MMRVFAEVCILSILLNVINTLLHQLNQTKANRSKCYISKFCLQGYFVMILDKTVYSDSCFSTSMLID